MEHITTFFKDYSDTFVCVGVIIALIQLFLTMRSIMKDNQRKKKESTFEAYIKAKDTIYPITHMLYERYEFNEIPIEDIKGNDELKENVKELLNTLEWLSTATLIKIYDKKTLDRLYRIGLIKNWDRFEKYIYNARTEVGDANMYIDFEQLVKEIR